MRARVWKASERWQAGGEGIKLISLFSEKNPHFTLLFLPSPPLCRAELCRDGTILCCGVRLKFDYKKIRKSDSTINSESNGLLTQGISKRKEKKEWLKLTALTGEFAHFNPLNVNHIFFSNYHPSSWTFLADVCLFHLWKSACTHCFQTFVSLPTCQVLIQWLRWCVSGNGSNCTGYFKSTYRTALKSKSKKIIKLSSTRSL